MVFDELLNIFFSLLATALRVRLRRGEGSSPSLAADGGRSGDSAVRGLKRSNKDNKL